MTKQEFLKALDIAALSPRLECKYAECMAAMKGEGTGFLSPKFVQTLQDELHIFHEKLDFVLEYAQKVCEHPALSRLGFLLTKTFDKRHGDDIIAFSELPSCPHGVDPVLFEMTVFLSQFAFAPELKLYYRWRGVDEATLSAMLTECFEAPLIASEKTLGRKGYDVVGLFVQTQQYLNHSIFNQRLAD